MRFVVFLTSFFLTTNGFAQQAYKKTLLLMGSRFDITVVADNDAAATTYISEATNEIQRIEQLISSWNPHSQTSMINSNAGIAPVQVDMELFQLIKRAIGISQLTDGAFDITYASMDKLWKFDGSMEKMPGAAAIRASVKNIGYQKIVLNAADTTVYLPQKGMKIGFGAIGKGYAADRAKVLLMQHGVSAGNINASGDMNTWGQQPDGQDWQVAITNPLDKKKSFALFSIKDKAVVTSGDYEKYVVFDGIRYAHIIDPRTGIPATGIISVTIFAPKAELADALATSVFVMGIETGIDRINQLNEVECIVIDDKGKVFTSENIEIDTE